MPDMVQGHKMIKRIDKVDIDALLTFIGERSTRGHNLKLFNRRACLKVRSNSFSNKIVDVWNALPESVVRAPSLNSFPECLNYAS